MLKNRNAKIVCVAVCLIIAVPIVAVVTAKWSYVRAAGRGNDLVAQADRLKELGLWFEAKPCYELAIKAFANSSMDGAARSGLAACLEVTRPSDAIALYSQIAGQAPDEETRASSQLAAAYVRMRTDVETAVGEFEAIQQAHPGTLVAHRAALGLAECLQTTGNYKLAQAKYRAVAAEAEGTPVAAEALLKLGRSLYGAENWDELAPGQEEVLLQVINHPLADKYIRAEAKWLLAVGYDGAKGENLLKEIVLDVPDTVRGARELGTVAGQRLVEGGPDACRDYLDEVLPKVEGTLCGEAAKEILALLDESGMWSDPTGVPPLMLALRAQFYWVSRNEHAGEALQAFIQQYPDTSLTPTALESLAKNLYLAKNYTEAVAVCMQLADTCPGAPEAPDAMRLIGVCYQQSGEADKALAAYQAVIDRYPSSHMSAVARCSIGHVLEENFGDRLGAIEAYRQTAAQYPETEQAQFAKEALERLHATQ